MALVLKCKELTRALNSALGPSRFEGVVGPDEKIREYGKSVGERKKGVTVRLSVGFVTLPRLFQFDKNMFNHLYFS